MEIQKLFYTPVSVISINNFERIKIEAIEQIKKMQANEKTHNYSNRGNNWHSDSNLAKKGGALSELAKIFITASAELSAQLSPEFKKQWTGSQPVSISMWANVVGPKGFHQPHNHPNSTWSGVCYLSVPDDMATDEGRIEFLDPRLHANGVGLPGTFYSTYFPIKAHEGNVVFFQAFWFIM